MYNNNSILPRNPGTEFHLDAFSKIRINKSATEKRCTEYSSRRSIKKQNQAAWLLKLISLIDLTTLSGDDTNARVKRLCRKAINPLNDKLVKSLSSHINDYNIGTKVDVELKPGHPLICFKDKVII